MPSSPPRSESPAAPQSALVRFDQQITRWLAADLPRPAIIRAPLAAFSLTANYGLLWYGLALLPWLFGEPDPLWRALYVAIPVTLVEATGFLIKSKIRRPRPVTVDPSLGGQIPVPWSHSFPSSHASMAVVGTFTLGAMYPQFLPALIVVAAVLCFSRIYLGVHYAGDVLGGVVYGLLWGAAWVLLVRAPA